MGMIMTLMNKEKTRKDWRTRWGPTLIIRNLMESRDTKIYLISKTSMPKLLKKSLNWTKNHQPIITTKGGFGCSSLGFVCRWSLITLINSENASLLPLLTCLSHNKDSLPFRHSKLPSKPKRKSNRFLRKQNNLQWNAKQLSDNQLKLMIPPNSTNPQTIIQLSEIQSLMRVWFLKNKRKLKRLKSLDLLPILSFRSRIFPRKCKISTFQLKTMLDWALMSRKETSLSPNMDKAKHWTNHNHAWTCSTRRGRSTRKLMKAWTLQQVKVDKGFYPE